MPGLSETTLQASTDVGHEDHQALVALPLLSAEIAGERRFVRLADRPDTADVALTVADAWHGRGLGCRAGSAGFQIPGRGLAGQMVRTGPERPAAGRGSRGAKLRLDGRRKIRWRACRISWPGTAMSDGRRVAITALPLRTPLPYKDVLAAGGGGELMRPGSHAGGQQGAPHPGHIHLG